MTVEDQLLEAQLRATLRRVAYACPVPALPELADDLDAAVDNRIHGSMLVVVEAAPVSIRRRQPLTRHRRATVWLTACAAGVVVLLVVLGAAALSGARAHRMPATVWNTTTPGYSTHYLLGPSSLPGFELGSAYLAPTAQSFQFDTPGHTFTYRSLTVDVFAMTRAVQADFAAMSKVRVGSIQGYFGTGPVTGKGVLQTLFGAAPPAKYEGVTPPRASVMVWPLDADHWAALSGTQGTDSQGEPNQVFAQDQLIRYAASVRPVSYDHAAPVKIGYLPAGLTFTVATAQPGTHATPSQPIPAGQIDSTNQIVAGDDNPGGTSGYSLSFSHSVTGDLPDTLHAPLTVDLVGNPAQRLAEATQQDPPSLMFPGPWQRTTIHGHLAWESPRDLLIQWGDVQIGVSTPRNEANHALGLISEGELIKVAKSLTVPDQLGFDHSFPLMTSVPAGSL